MARILYVNYERTPSGATVHRDRLYESLKALGAQVTLLAKPPAAGAAPPGPRPDRLKRWLYFRHTDWALLLMLGRHLRRELLAFLRVRPQVLFLNFTMYLSAIAVARLLRIPVVLQIHAPPYLGCRYAGLPLRWGPLWEAVERWALASADAILVVARPLKEYYVARGVPEAKLSVVPNGADLARFRPETDPAGVIAGYGLKGTTVLGYVGILDRWAGIDRLVELVPWLAARHQSLKLLIVGDGPMREELELSVRRRGLEERVILTGFVPHAEIPQHLAAMDVAVAPYRPVELFYFSSMKLVEYLAMGRAVVAPRTGEIPELVSDGENGVLYPPGDQSEMAARILELLDSPSLRAELGRRAAERITARRWTWEANAREVLRTLSAVAGGAMEACPSRS